MENLIYIALLVIAILVIAYAVYSDYKEYDSKLGVIQKAWLKSLKKNPERQTAGVLMDKLGQYLLKSDATLYINKCAKEEIKYQSCCLGEGLLTLIRNGHKIDDVYDGNIRPFLPSTHDANQLGLHDNAGTLNGGTLNYKGVSYDSLAYANDSNVPWKFIAKFIERNPTVVFYKVV